MSIFNKKVKPISKKKTKPTLEREKLEAEIGNLTRSPWKKVSTWISIVTIVATLITVKLIWDSKALEIYNANLTSDIKEKEANLATMVAIKNVLTDSIKIYGDHIKSLTIAKQYYDSIFSIMNSSSDANKKLIAGMAKNVTDLRNANSFLQDSANYYKQLYAMENHEFVLPNNQQNLNQLFASNALNYQSVLVGLSGNNSSYSIGSSHLSQQFGLMLDSAGNIVQSNQIPVIPLSSYQYGQASTFLNGATSPVWNPSASNTSLTSTQVQFPTLDSAIRYFYSQQNKNGLLNTSLQNK